MVVNFHPVLVYNTNPFLQNVAWPNSQFVFDIRVPQVFFIMKKKGRGTLVLRTENESDRRRAESPRGLRSTTEGRKNNAQTQMVIRGNTTDRHLLRLLDPS